MLYLSVCSGIEAATVAWKPLGWTPQGFAEIEPFCCAVLAHHYPDVTNYGDFTKITSAKRRPDVLVGGTPCQSFSVAGRRLGLDDPRGNLTLEFLRLVSRLRPRWIVWENVPGVLSIDGGRTFGAILGALAELGYGFAYRILDAQYFGVPQRRRRVFVVGHLGAWQAAAAVLFERESLRRNIAPSREASQITSALTANSLGICGGDPKQAQENHVVAVPEIVGPLAPNTGPRGHDAGNFGCNQGVDAGHIIPVSFKPSHFTRGKDGAPSETVALAFGGNNTTGPVPVATACRAKGGTGHGDFESETFIVQGPIPILGVGARTGKSVADPRAGIGIGAPGDPMYTLQTGKQHAVAIHENQRAEISLSSTAGSLKVGGRKPGQGYPCVAVACRTSVQDGFVPHDRGAPEEVCPPLKAQSGATGKGDSAPVVVTRLAVRRLTPRECERLQGFPDDYTLIPNYRRKLNEEEVEEMAAYLGIPLEEARKLGATPDGPRYRAIGNSMAVPVMRWIGERIATVDAIGGEL